MSWFAPPEPIATRVLFRLPPAFQHPVRSDWADANRGGVAIGSFLEGPTFGPDGTLFVVDIPHGRVFAITPSGDWRLVAAWDGWPNGLARLPNGHLLVADYRRGLLRLDPSDGSLTPVLTHVRSESFKGLNDLVLARDGTVYITDQGQTGLQDPTGRVYRLCPDGRVERLLDTGPSPNGIVLDPAERHLFVAMTRACQVWRTAVTADSVLAKVNCFAHTPGGTSGPDGLAMLADGGLAIANPGHGCVWVVSPTGVPRWVLPSCTGSAVTNLAFDPADPHRLVITESETGTILEARLPVPGHPCGVAG